MGDTKNPGAGGRVQEDNNAASGMKNQSGNNQPGDHFEGGGPHQGKQDNPGSNQNAEKQFGKAGLDTNDGGQNDRDPVEGARNEFGTGNEQEQGKNKGE
jgi:hypothetical protein